MGLYTSTEIKGVILLPAIPLFSNVYGKSKPTCPRQEREKFVDMVLHLSASTPVVFLLAIQSGKNNMAECNHFVISLVFSSPCLPIVSCLSTNAYMYEYVEIRR